MTNLLSGVTASVRSMARAAAFSAAVSIVALILALVGLGCLTAALWIVIATHQGGVFAFAVIGVIYLALGAVLLLLAAYPPRGNRRRERHRDHEYYDDPRAPREPFVQIAEGFVMGIQAGRAARRRR